MNTFIRLPAERQRLFYEEGRQRLGLAPASIEKDFWVCWTLRELFNLPEWGERLTFKGGTSLSKNGAGRSSLISLKKLGERYI